MIKALFRYFGGRSQAQLEAPQSLLAAVGDRVGKRLTPPKFILICGDEQEDNARSLDIVGIMEQFHAGVKVTPVSSSTFDVRKFPDEGTAFAKIWNATTESGYDRVTSQLQGKPSMTIFTSTGGIKSQRMRQNIKQETFKVAVDNLDNTSYVPAIQEASNELVAQLLGKIIDVEFLEEKTAALGHQIRLVSAPASGTISQEVAVSEVQGILFTTLCQMVDENSESFQVQLKQLTAGYEEAQGLAAEGLEGRATKRRKLGCASDDIATFLRSYTQSLVAKDFERKFKARAGEAFPLPGGGKQQVKIFRFPVPLDALASDLAKMLQDVTYKAQDGGTEMATEFFPDWINTAVKDPVISKAIKKFAEGINDPSQEDASFRETRHRLLEQHACLQREAELARAVREAGTAAQVWSLLGAVGANVGAFCWAEAVTQTSGHITTIAPLLTSITAADIWEVSGGEDEMGEGGVGGGGGVGVSSMSDTDNGSTDTAESIPIPPDNVAARTFLRQNRGGGKTWKGLDNVAATGI